ncbi:hypothetical protein E4T44_02990 [Aureobasidium sp. EXF-8845]|nr:hypothetical protein E4T44_02990 [Aureobasidium sp. EXF-8845]KAI4855482.1 hypothetical protein E4T45_03081 [Aureobasidium sp. EXF-8846]
MNDHSVFAWAEYDALRVEDRKALGVYNQRRRVVQSQIAYTLSGTRKATTARREQIRQSQRDEKTVTSSEQQQHDQQARNCISLLFASLRWLRSRIAPCYGRNAFTGNSGRNAFTGNNACFQAATFIAETFANTCGKLRRVFHTGSGSGLLFLRGASLGGIQTTTVDTPNNCLNSVSIVLPTGWERRFGDRSSYEVQMRAWETLLLALTSLDAGKIAASADVALENFWEASQEQYLGESGASGERSLHQESCFFGRLPPGFRVIPTSRPKSMSRIFSYSRCLNEDVAASTPN